MKVGIIGAGAMGSLFGGKLSLRGHDVVLYDVYLEHVKQVATQGLSIEDAQTGRVRVAHPRASADPASVQGADILVVFVKSPSTEAVAAQFAPLAGPRAIALTLQNGLGNEAVLKNHFGPDRTAAGVTSQGATFLGPGKIRHAGVGPTHLAMADGRSERLQGFADALTDAGFETHVEKDVAGLVWSKLVINVGINALTALISQPNGRLLDFEETRQLMAALVEEAATVAARRGIRLSYPDPLATVMEVARKTGANRSSMLQDFDRRRQTEIDYMNGAVVREAAALGMKVPVNETVTRLIKALERVRGEP